MTNLFKLLTRTLSEKISYLIFALLLIKLIIAAGVPLVGDETYYWLWGQNLQLSYFDHPAGVGLMTHISQWLALPTLALNLRWPFVILSSLTVWIGLKTLENLQANQKQQQLFVLHAHLNPMLGIGGILATPDVPFLFFWALSFYFVVKILQTQKTFYYAALGACLGLGFCSKYHAALFPMIILISLYITGKISQIQIRKLVITILFGLVLTMPVLIWNYQNDWASFQFQLKHGFDTKGFNPYWIFTYIVAQILLFNPFLFLNILQSFKKQLFPAAATINWSFFCISAIRAPVEANWPIASHYLGMIQSEPGKTSTHRNAIRYWIFLWALIFIGLATAFGQSKLKSLPQSWSAEEIYQQIQPQLATNSNLPLFGPTYQMSSLLSYLTKQEIRKLPGLTRFDFYDDLAKKSSVPQSFLVLKYDTTDWPDWIKEQNRVVELQSLTEYKMKLYRVSHE